MQEHSPRCDQLSGCSSCWGCPDCRSLHPCSCREREEQAQQPKPARKLSMASMYLANRNRRGADGRFNPASFVRQAEKIGDTIRAAREAREENER